MILVSYPFLIIFLGIFVTYAYQNHTNHLGSYLIGIFAASFIQIYPPKKRALLFLFGFLPFNVMMYFMHGFDIIFFEGLRFSLMVFLLGYLYTMITYWAYKNQSATMQQLADENQMKTDNIEQMTKIYADLESSHRITEAMMLITTEILKNEQLDDVLQLVLNEAVKLVPQAQAGSILILTDGQMRFRAAHGYDLKNLRKITLRIEDLFQSKQADLYQPTIVKNLEAFDEAHLNEETLNQFQENRALVAKAVLSCSFKYDGKFFGSINLDNFNSENAFNESDEYMIRHLAKQLEITIAIHKLYEKALLPTKYDELTQAYTRKHFKELLSRSVINAIDNQIPFSICTIDINNFKEINDRYGHDIGDDCLSFFASAIRSVAPDNMMFSRIGGDEFSFAFLHANIQEVSQHIDHIRDYLKLNPIVIQGKPESLAFACGIASYPEDSGDLRELFKLSDRRMYEDKSKMKTNPDPHH